jgi:TRAP-type mannitol/chloroaromatic compound transport system permease small subunit
MTESNVGGERAGPDLRHVEDRLIHHTELPRTVISDILDGIIRGIGEACSWLWLPVVAVILVSVVSRYVFSSGSVTMEEIQWHIAGVAWLVGLSYTLTEDGHVRVDVLHERFSLRTQAWLEFWGILFLLLPFAVIAVWESAPFFLSSFGQGERSQAPGGLPARWAIKFFLPFSFALLTVAAVSRLLRCTALLFRVPRPRQVSGD